MPFIVGPAETTFSSGSQNSLLPWGGYGSDWQRYNAALASMFEPGWALVADRGSPDEPGYVAGWSTLLDPTTCPTQYLPYCGQFIGVFVPPGTADATARQMILGEAGFSRGTPAAITAAAKRWLTGSQYVTLFERTGADGTTEDAYHFVMIVLVSQVINADALTAAVNAVKPGGVQWTLLQADTWLIDQLENQYATIADVEGAFSNIINLEGDTPNA